MHRPAVVVSCDPQNTMTVNVQVWCDGNKELGDKLGNMFYRHTVTYDPNCTAHGTWHWPEDDVTMTETRRHD